ncbi:MAG: hypothetical protein MUF18_17220 [Fimbriiglobus sp.]|jgi:hypothetical protein|nr:hypothetical protein [Fimbriiglobus sp.]
MRRLLMAACFLASTLAVVALAGCGGSEGGTKTDTSPNTKQVEKEKRR